MLGGSRRRSNLSCGSSCKKECDGEDQDSYRFLEPSRKNTQLFHLIKNFQVLIKGALKKVLLAIESKLVLHAFSLPV